jgi:hypothetical protein
LLFFLSFSLFVFFSFNFVPQYFFPRFGPYLLIVLFYTFLNLFFLSNCLPLFYYICFFYPISVHILLIALFFIIFLICFLFKFCPSIFYFICFLFNFGLYSFNCSFYYFLMIKNFIQDFFFPLQISIL